eukprot:gene10845-14558_t
MSGFASLDLLEKHLATRSYIQGYSLSPADKKELVALKGLPSRATHPNTYRWAIHIVALTGEFIGASSAPATTAPPAKSSAAPASKPTTTPAKKPVAKDEDFDDMFGGDDEELNEDGETAAEAAATKARQERMALAKKLKEEKEAKDNAGKEKKQKEKPVEKSLCVLEVKPWEADTDLEKVWHKIKEYKQEGLSWGETFKLEPVAFGIKKLVMTCVIVDSLVLMDDITENIESLEEWVQSVNVASMNKIS